MMPQSEPPTVRIVEVGPRDGLQNEPGTIPTAAKVRFINDLSAAGLSVIEATSFVNPKAVPQLADATDVMRQIDRHSGVLYPVLVPNQRGFERAIDAGADAIALFTAATEAFASANVGTSIDGTFDRFAPVAEGAKSVNAWLRGYVSVAFGCPYAGRVPVSVVIEIASRLFALGCAEVSLADTIGVATPDNVDAMLVAASTSLPMHHLALHFHDTRGQAIQNVEVGLKHGIRVFDAAAGGLGGCPFAPGAPGNLATETLIQYLDEEGISTGVGCQAVAEASARLRPHLTSVDSTPAQLQS